MPGGPDEQIFLPGLAKATDLLFKILSGDLNARILQAQNAPQLIAEVQGTLTPAVAVDVPLARNRTVAYSWLVIVFDSTAGSGRYSFANNQSAAGGGFEIPSGGGPLTVFGSEQIRNFKMIAETGQTLPFTYGLFQ